jgi:hypothetical protein
MMRMVSLAIFVVEVIGLAKGDVCPFDGLPCDYVDSCDDVVALRFTFRDIIIDNEDGTHCSRACALTPAIRYPRISEIDQKGFWG